MLCVGTAGGLLWGTKIGELHACLALSSHLLYLLVFPRAKRAVSVTDGVIFAGGGRMKSLCNQPLLGFVLENVSCFISDADSSLSKRNVS